MSVISSKDIQSIAQLARLNIDDNVSQEHASSLSKILSMMDILNAVETQDIAPLTNIHETCQTLRADIPNIDIDRTANQAIAPSVDKGLYLVPQVIE